MAATATGKRNARLALNGRVESWPVIGSRRAAKVVSKESLASYLQHPSRRSARDDEITGYERSPEISPVAIS